jgi:hypothetical protein
MNDNDLRDCFAMFALNGILSCNYDVGEEPAVLAYKYADKMIEAKYAVSEEKGLAAIRPKRRYDKKVRA